MSTTFPRRLRAWAVQRVYLLLGIMFLLVSLTLTTHAMLTVSDFGLSGDADVAVDAAGTLNLGTASSTAITIGNFGIPVTIPGSLAVNGTLTLGSASTTGQLVFQNASTSFTTLLQASSSQASSLSFTLPNTTGTTGQAMLTDGTGNLYFGNAGSSQWVNGENGSISYNGGNVAISTTVLVAYPGAGVDAADILQAKIDAASAAGGGTVQLADGVWRISKQVMLKSNVHLRGTTRYTTIIKPDVNFCVSPACTYGAAFRSLPPSGRYSNITVSNIGMDGTDVAPPFSDSRPGFLGFALARFDATDNIDVHDVYQHGGHGVIGLQNCEHFQIAHIHAKNVEEGFINFFTGVKYGTVSDLNGEDVGEIVDFFNNDEIKVIGVRASSSATNTEDEAFDISTSRNIHISDVIANGFRNGITLKTETASNAGWQDITIDNCQFYNFRNAGMYAQGSLAAVALERLRVTNSVFKSSIAATIGLDIRRGDAGGNDYLIQNNYIDVPGRALYLYDVDDAILKGNKIRTAEYGIYVAGPDAARVQVVGNDIKTTTTTASALWVMGNAIDPLVDGNIVSSASVGIEVKGALRPRVVNNRVMAAGSYGIYVWWGELAGLDMTAATINAVVDGNEVRNWGTAVANRAGILFQLNLGAGQTGTLKGASISGNRLWTDSTINANGQYGIMTSKGSLASLDFVKIDNNLITYVPLTTSFATCGAGCTTANNTASTR